MVTIQTGLDEDGNPVYAALKDTKVQLRKKGSSTIIETMTTDAHGW